MTVDVRTIQRYRRRLHFGDYSALLADARRLVELAGAAGEAPREYGADGTPLPGASGVEYLANLNTGQSLGHMALWMAASIDGINLPHPPWLLRIAVRLLRERFLSQTVPPGFKLPAAGGDYFIPSPTTTPAQGLASLEAALDRLASATLRVASPLFGALSAAEWDRLHLRHAELHLSYLLPRE